MAFLSKRSAFVYNPILEEDDAAAKLAEKGIEVMKLNRGDPAFYFPTPKYIIDAYVEALRAGKTYYSDSAGVKELREAVARRYKRMYNVNADPDKVIATAGISEGLAFINSALIDNGDRAVIFKPYYVQYITNLREYGGKPLFGIYDENDGWNIHLEHIRGELRKMKRAGKIGRVKYMILKNPNNPTGTVLRRKVLREIVDIANENDIVLVSDEIYDEIVYNGAEFTSIGQVSKGVPHVILHGASKVFDATGFRMGYMVLPENDRKSIAIRGKIKDYARMRLSLNTPAEYALAEGINNRKEHDRAIKGMVSRIEKRVNSATAVLKRSDAISVVRPNGAFYILPRLKMSKLRIKDDKEFIGKVLEEEHIQITRGSGFGCPNHFRIVALAPETMLSEAAERIGALLDKYAK